jgi:transcriptional regulator with XRE-family HTH domain
MSNADTAYEPEREPSAIFARRMKKVRGERGWSQAQLAELLTANGFPVSQVIVARIENRARGVSLDEALIISATLSVAPAHMFVPLSRAEQVQLGKRLLEAGVVADWVMGSAPLPGASPEDERTYVINRDPAVLAALLPMPSAEERQRHLEQMKAWEAARDPEGLLAQADAEQQDEQEEST